MQDKDRPRAWATQQGISDFAAHPPSALAPAAHTLPRRWQSHRRDCPAEEGASQSYITFHPGQKRLPDSAGDAVQLPGSCGQLQPAERCQGQGASDGSGGMWTRYGGPWVVKAGLACRLGDGVQVQDSTTVRGMWTRGWVTWVVCPTPQAPQLS